MQRWLSWLFLIAGVAFLCVAFLTHFARWPLFAGAGLACLLAALMSGLTRTHA